MDRKLPDWLKESREAEKLIAWLKSPDCEVKEFSGQLFIKARYGNCFFFFDCLKENRKTDRNWCAVIHIPSMHTACSTVNSPRQVERLIKIWSNWMKAVMTVI